MLDSCNSTRPERRSALIAPELASLNIYIVALSEIRLSEEGCLTEQGAGYALYWSGKSPEDRCLSGVGFMVRDSIATKLTNLPIGHSNRIISMRLPLSVQQHATFFSVYAPTLQADPAEREQFCTDLSSLLRNVPANDKIVILGDVYARVGRD